jgi:hypothetical protein
MRTSLSRGHRRGWVGIAVAIALIGAARGAGAQPTPRFQLPVPLAQPTPIPVPTFATQAFGFYQCSCTPSSVGVPSQQQLVVTAPIAWTGTVYASTDQDAAMKAQRACSSETRGSPFSCLQCSCQR